MGAWLKTNAKQLAVAIISIAMVYVIKLQPKYTDIALLVAMAAGIVGLHIPAIVYRLAGVAPPPLPPLAPPPASGDESPKTPDNAGDGK